MPLHLAEEIRVQLCLARGVEEDDDLRVRRGLAGEVGRKRGCLCRARDERVALRDVLVRRVVRIGDGGDELMVFKKGKLGDFTNTWRDSCGEKERLPCETFGQRRENMSASCGLPGYRAPRREGANNALHIGCKTFVEETVRLIKYKEA
jgi:hypothetical protein